MRQIVTLLLLGVFGLALYTMGCEKQEEITGSSSLLPTVGNILLGVSPTTLPADGSSQANLSASPLDTEGNPLSDGTVVTFTVSSGSGRIPTPVRTTRDGIAEATYIAGTTAGPVSISVSAGDSEVRTSITLTAPENSGVTLSAESVSVLADGLSSTLLTVQVADLSGNPVAPGTVVDFTTTRGSIEDIVPTDDQGVATATLRSERFVTGLARLTARVGDSVDILDIQFVSEAAAHIVIASVERPAIGVLGSSDPETSTLIFEAQDANGIPVDSDHAIEIEFSIEDRDETDATLWPTSATTDAQGRAATTLSSGTVSGAVRVDANSGSIESLPIRVAIHGDLPDPDHFSFSVERLNVEGLVYDGIHYGVTARVGDVHGNPVPDSTVVWFSSESGLIQGSAVTDDHGEATVWAITAGPRPQIPGGDGLVDIQVQTISKTGEWIEKHGNVMWSGPTIIEILSPQGGFDVQNGESVLVDFRVWDANENPLTGGTSIQVTSNGGDLQGDTNIVLPDTQSRGATVFSVVLADSDPSVNEAKAVTVTIEVTSLNGNRTASITGAIH